MTYGLGIFFIERIADLIVLAASAWVVVLHFYATSLSTFGFIVGQVVLILISLIYVFSGLNGCIYDRLNSLSKRCHWSRRLISERLLVLKDQLTEDVGPKQRIVILGMTGAAWIMIAIGIGAFLYSLEMLQHWTEPLGYFVSTNFAAFLSPLPANIGSYQIAGTSLLAAYGTHLGDALIFAIYLHLAMLFQTVCAGSISLGIISLKQHRCSGQLS